jgi:PPOX class probable F420-dependent enzyme
MEFGASVGTAGTLPSDLDRHRYLSLTSYRRDGRGVATPVWFVTDDGTIYVSTGETTGKARRLRHDPRVTLGPSDGRGRLRGASFEAVAAVAPAGDEPRIEALFDRKYPVAKPVLTFLWKLGGVIGRQTPGREIYLAITPVGGSL